jgi:hypothetical protein
MKLGTALSFRAPSSCLWQVGGMLAAITVVRKRARESVRDR